MQARGGKFGVIGSNHTTNEENYYLQKFAREVLGTNNIDHHRTGDVVTLAGRAERQDGRAGHDAPICTSARPILVIGADLAQQHPFLAFQIRANYRHHGAHVYTVTPGPGARRQIRGAQLDHRTGPRIRRPGIAARPAESRAGAGDPVRRPIKGDAVRKLVAFGESLGIPVKYVCLVDYSNSRGAFDMGLVPESGPGYQPAARAGPGLRRNAGGADWTCSGWWARIR